jgi:predicted CXXCH cytochrome family protein
VRRVLSCLLLCVLGPAQASELQVEYVGALKCRNCHSVAYNNWLGSDHYMSMQTAEARYVKGDFSGAQVRVNGTTWRFVIKDGIYTVVSVGENKAVREYRVKYTFGHYPLQQYLVELEKGFVQALNIAWDNRPAPEGGQKWYYLREGENVDSEHPFFWTRHFQNWNSRCADCHSTNVNRNYDEDRATYQTTFSEINVSCEACHGAASIHVGLAESGTLSAANRGFTPGPVTDLRWSFVNGEPIAKPNGHPRNRDTDMCGGCHSLRTPLTSDESGQPGDNYHDRFYLQLIEEPAYHADGQIRDEVFVLGSFLQSKMHDKGVSCGNCHDPHSGKLLIKGNGLCAQCHRSSVFDVAAHHHHSEASEGAACVNCHMPATTYMSVDSRRDHGFTVPDPALSRQTGSPIACENCHQAEIKTSANWAFDQMKKWRLSPAGPDHWGYLNHRVSRGDVLVSPEIRDLIVENKLPAIIEASLLSGLASMPSTVSVALAQVKLTSESPLERRAAVASVRNMPVRWRWKFLAPLLEDENRSVRFILAEVLADTLVHLPAASQEKLKSLLDEYRSMLALSADTPTGQLALASLELNLGNLVAAENALRRALEIEPNYVPALINMADYFRESNQEEKVESLLRRALNTAPDSGAAQHSYGLFLVRQKDYRNALTHLKIAMSRDDAHPRYAFVYAVALDSQGKTRQALEVLEQASLHWPNQYDLLLTRISYLEKLGDTDSVLPVLSRLSAIAPDSPAVRTLVGKYVR